MVADVVTVISRAYGSEEAYQWESRGADGYTIKPCEKDTVGTEVILKIKENSEGENYDQYLDQYTLRSIIKKYSDFIRYPIKMDITERRPKEGNDSEFEEVTGEQIINSMVPIRRKQKMSSAGKTTKISIPKAGTDLTSRLGISISAPKGLSAIRPFCLSRKRLLLIFTPEYEKGLSSMPTAF